MQRVWKTINEKHEIVKYLHIFWCILKWVVQIVNLELEQKKYILAESQFNAKLLSARKLLRVDYPMLLF